MRKFYLNSVVICETNFLYLSKIITEFITVQALYTLQVIKNIRNVTRHRNGQSVKSRQTRWEWQLLISIMHIHAVVTRYNNCAFLCACHVNITVFFALPPCCVDESYSRVCVLVDDHAIFYFNHRRDKVILHFCFRQCVSQCH